MWYFISLLLIVLVYTTIMCIISVYQPSEQLANAMLALPFLFVVCIATYQIFNNKGI